MTVSNFTLNIIYLISFMDLFAVGLTFPVLAPYIRSLGVSHLTVGVLSSAYSAFQVLSGPLIGAWSDVRGRKSVFHITLFLSAVCYLLLGWCTSIYSIFFLRLLLGVFKHTQTLSKAITADYVESRDNSKVFGRAMAFGSLGFVVGPVIGGHLSELQNGFMYICSLTAVLFLINIGLVYCLPDTPSPSGNLPKQNSVNSILENVKNELVKSASDIRKIDWSLHWVSFLFILSTTTFFVNQSLYLKEKHQLSQKHIGYMISFIGTIGFISSFFSGTITRRFYGNRPDSCLRRAYHCFLVFTVCYGCFYLSSNRYVLMVLLLPYGIANAILRIVTMEIMMNRCKVGDRGTLTGASDSVMSLGRFVAPVSAGVIGDVFSENAVMLYAMLPCVVGTAVCFCLKPKIDSKLKT